MATTLLAAALGLSGALAYPFLRIAPLPLVDFPSLTINAVLPGANPETMASAVAAPLERQLGHIAGVNEMTSASALGTTTITLQFGLDRNIDAAARDVQAAINAARSQLPSNLPQKPSWKKANPADVPFMFLALTSETMGPRQIYDVASTVLQQKFSQIRGVGQVNITGGSLPAVRIDVNPTQLNHFGLSMEDVRTFLASANANRPKGDFTNANNIWSLNTTDQLLIASEYQPLVVGYRNGGAVRKLSDVANVLTDSMEDVRALGPYANGKPSIILLIYRQPGENIVEVFDRVKAAIPDAQAASPPALHMNILLDATNDIRESVKDIEITMGISIALVIMVVFLFLRSPRTTSIPAVAVPLSLAGTFGVLYLFDYSLDNLSLMALTIATGFVVDDAIVVIENITRYIERGMSPGRAALRGAREIGPTVVSISLSLIAVFIPILLMEGFVGRLFREFAIALSTAVLISLVVSLTLTPMMCAHLLKGRDEEPRHGVLWRISERFFQFVLRVYEVCLTWVLRHQPLTLAVTLATIAITVRLYIVIPKGFFPQQDTGRMSGQIQADQSTSFSAMRQRIIQTSDIIRADPNVQNVMAFMGGRGGALNNATMFMTLKPFFAAQAKRRSGDCRAAAETWAHSRRRRLPAGHPAGSHRHAHCGRTVSIHDAER